MLRSVVLSFLFVATLHCQPFAMKGKWTGLGTQRNPEAQWTMEVDFLPDGEKGNVVYPSLTCGGTLTKVRPNVWLEQIEYGVARCHERGRYLVLPVSANQVMLHYESLDPRAPDTVGRVTLSGSNAKPTNCGDDAVIEQYSPEDKSYHSYSVVTEVCTKGGPECTADKVFDVMLRDKRRISPTRETGPVTSCGSTNVRIPFYEYLRPSPIRTFVDRDGRRVINYTLPGHELHPGRVVRQIVDEERVIKVWTRGEGTGILPFLNEILAPLVWEDVDEELKKGVLSPN